MTQSTEIELAIMEQFKFHRNLIVPGVTPFAGGDLPVQFETDMIVLTKAGYAHGFEIKISKSDLHADLKKYQYKKLAHGLDFGLKACYNGYKHFSYAVPGKLVVECLEKLPSCFGIYRYDLRRGRGYEGGIRTLSEVRKPTVLFDRKWNERERYNLARLGAMRIYNLKVKTIR